MQNDQKPVIQIRNACFINYPNKQQALSGIVEDYPEEHMGYPGCVTNGRYVTTSAVVNVDGDMVETQRSTYKVLSWAE
jgi:hypothetical protein